MLVFNEASTGAADDLNKATDIARNMVARFGMHEKLGLVTYETPRQTFLGEDALAHFADREFSEDTAREIDCAVRELMTNAFEKASAILHTYRRQLDEGAKPAPREGNAHARGASPARDPSAGHRCSVACDESRQALMDIEVPSHRCK
jgi:ATP-dependent Zn protease